MSAETTATTLTEIVNSEVIADVLLATAMDATVIAPLARVMNLAGKGSSTASFPQWDAADSVTSITEGSTTLSNVAFETTEVATIAAAQVGILRELTEFSKEVNTLGPAGLVQAVMQDGAALMLNELEDSLASRFSGFSATVGTTTTDLSVANFVEAMAKLDTANARGRKVCVLDDQQAYDLRAAVAASTGTVFGNSGQNTQDVLNARSDAYVGQLFGVPIWMTNLTDTANTAADVVGAMFVDGSTNPEYAALGIALLWLPRIHRTTLADQVADQIAITIAYGTGRISEYGCDITTDA